MAHAFDVLVNLRLSGPAGRDASQIVAVEGERAPVPPTTKGSLDATCKVTTGVGLILADLDVEKQSVADLVHVIQEPLPPSPVCHRLWLPPRRLCGHERRRAPEVPVGRQSCCWYRARTHDPGWIVATMLQLLEAYVADISVEPDAEAGGAQRLLPEVRHVATVVDLKVFHDLRAGAVEAQAADEFKGRQVLGHVC
eukprot:scaffold3291_cov229-Pinguiococcus_pyrenoidosus.AAC.3